jgi:hypothetical protein
MAILGFPPQAVFSFFGASIEKATQGSIAFSRLTGSEADVCFIRLSLGHDVAAGWSSRAAQAAGFFCCSG